MLALLPILPWRASAVLAGWLVWTGGGRASDGEEVSLPLGADFQAIIDEHPSGSHYVIRSGIHRGIEMVPKDGDVISGEPGAVLNGCLQLTEWRREGEWWVHDTPVVAPTVAPPGLGCAHPSCADPQDLYVDDELLQATTARDQVWDDKWWFLDREAGRIYLRRDPTGREVEFGGPASRAIDCAPPGKPQRRDVIIEDLKIEKYPCIPQGGQVRLAGGSICRRSDIGWSHSYGIEVSGSATVQDCYLHHNGQCGIGGGGRGILIEGCEIAHNVRWYYTGVAWDMGGVKLSGASEVVLRRCYVHHNKGPGIWFDIKSNDVLIEDSIVEFSNWEGMLIEISHDLVIKRNICRWNGLAYRGANEGALWGAQICLQNARDIEIDSNYLECGFGQERKWGSGQGIMAFNQNPRVADEQSLGGDFSVRNLNVHHNLVLTPDRGHNGIDDGTLGWETYEEFVSSGLVWSHNRYLTGEPLNQWWSWREPGTWSQNGASWMTLGHWRQYQDEGSELQTFGPNQYQPTDNSQWGLIQQVTGHEYPAFKAGLIRRPALALKDADLDGVPDEWEVDYFGRVEAKRGSDDVDGDGWDNIREYSEGTDPKTWDTDEDGLPDRWESERGLNPKLFDSETDADLDERSALEEYEDKTDPLVAQSLVQAIPESALSMWLVTTSGLETDGTGRVLRWVEHSPARQEMSWVGVPKVISDSQVGTRLVALGARLLCPGNAQFWGTAAEGFTMSFVFQPETIDLTGESRAILTNEHYLQAGFRLRLVSGYLVCSSAQSGGSLTLAGTTKLVAGRTYCVSIVYSGMDGPRALYLDGAIEAWTTKGVVVPSTATLMLGDTNGVAPQPGAIGDVVVFKRALSHLERRSVETLLRQKFRTGFPTSTDRDSDGMPDAYEIEHRLDPTTPDGLGDDDSDGAVNLAELQRGTDPQGSDTDGDGMTDGWEIHHALDPLTRDGDGDPDLDGAPNVIEFEEGSDPQQATALPRALDFPRVRLWWRTAVGLELQDQKVIRWADSSAGGHDGTRFEGSDGPSVVAESWFGNPSVGGSAVVSLASEEINMDTVVHQRGVTLMAAFRFPAALGPPGVFQPLLTAAGASLGAIDGRLAARSPREGTLLTAAAAGPIGPAVATLTLPLTAGKARLYLNGQLLAEGDGKAPALTGPVQLGGMTDPWPAEVAEVVVFAGVLPHRHRVLWERMLAGKWQGLGSFSGDRDEDGLPDWWEWEAATDPLVSDAAADADFDGVPNRSAFEQRRCGFVWKDADRDGMHDGWETAHGLDAQSDDAGSDLDGDGLPNVVEHALGTGPEGAQNPAEAWSAVPVGDAAAPGATLRFWNNHRSWRARAFPEESESLADGGWRLLRLPDPVDPPQNGISQIELERRPTVSGPRASHFRLRLLAE